MAPPAAPPRAPPPTPSPARRAFWKVLPYAIAAALIVGAGIVFWYRNMDVGAILVVIGVVIVLNWVVNGMRRSWAEDTEVDLE